MKTNRLSRPTRYLLMAACSILIAGSLSSCSLADPAGEVLLSGKWQISIPATIGQDPDTRTLEYKDGKLTAKFSIKDNIYVIKNGAVDSQPLHPDKDGTTANLEGVLEGKYAAGDVLTLVYNSKGTFSFAKQTGGHVENDDLNAFDYAVATVTVTNVSGESITTTPAFFQSLQSMYKFTFVDSEGEPVKVTRVIVTTKSGDLITSSDIFGTSVEKGAVIVDVKVDAVANNVVWVALSKSGNGADTFIFEALDEENNVYRGTLDVNSGVIQNGKFYTATITLHLHNPLTLEAIEPGTITIKNPNGLVISYVKNNGTSVTGLENNTADIKISVTNGDVVRFYGDNETYCIVDSDENNTNISNTNISCSSDCCIYGNIMSLIDSDGYDTATTLTGDYTFMMLFEGNPHIKNHAAKALTLPATTLTKGCYMGMFYGCSKLETAPILPAENLKAGCYEFMFSGCSLLNSVTCLATDISAVDCTNSWLNNVASEGTFYKASGITEDAWRATGIPSGWTVKDYTE